MYEQLSADQRRQLNELLSMTTIRSDGTIDGQPSAPLSALMNPPAPQAPQEPRNFIRNESTGEMTSLDNAVGNQPKVLREWVTPKGTTKRLVQGVGMDGFGRQTAQMYEEEVIPDYLNPAKIAQQKAEDAGLERKLKMAQLAETLGQDPAAILGISTGASSSMDAGMTTDAAKQKFYSRKFGNAPTGHRWDANGNAVPIPGLEKPLTEFQGKSAGYGARASAADATLANVGRNGEVQPGIIKRSLEAIPFIGDSLGTMANITQSTEQQQVEQAQRDFVNAVLRQESGAAISAGEFDNARKQYFPQPGDSPEVIAQKARNRQTAIEGFSTSAGASGSKLISNARDKAQMIFEAHKAIAKGAPKDAVKQRLESMGITNSGI